MRQINKLCLPFQSYVSLAEIIEQNIFSVFFALDDEGYIDYWLTEFNNILPTWMKNKRRKRLLYPPYYTSHSMHLLNCVETEDRKPRQKPSKLWKSNVKNPSSSTQFSSLIPLFIVILPCTAALNLSGISNLTTFHHVFYKMT